MKAVVQRVTRASVTIDGRIIAAIDAGLLVLAAVEMGDTDDDLRWCADKIPHLRIFPDVDGRMNRSVIEAGGRVLLVSNFTVAGDCRRGRRPSFDAAMKPPEAEGMFERFVEMVRSRGVLVQTGVFGAMMEIELVNDGPVTLVIDSNA